MDNRSVNWRPLQPLFVPVAPAHSSKRPTDADTLERGVKRSRGQLNLTKCARCRLDKVNCSPKTRVWPQKCERCIQRGFPCSEGTRVMRQSKHNPEARATPSHAIETLADTGVTYRDWQILLGHYQHLKAGSRILESIQENTKKIFGGLQTKARPARLDRFYQDIKLVGTTLSESASQLDLANCRSAISELLAHEGLRMGPDEVPFKCLICEAADPSYGQGREHPTYAELRGYSGPWECEYCHEKGVWWSDLHVERFGDMLQSFVVGLQEVLKRFPNLIQHGTQAPTMAPLLAWDEITSCELDALDHQDCIGRTQLLRLFDAKIQRLDVMMDLIEEEFREDINTGDILGRTVLHSACCKGWSEGVRLLLRVGADPGLKTHYNHLPIHYAAARGSYKICELLMEHRHQFDVRARDIAGLTAAQYAQRDGRTDIVLLLVTCDVPSESASGHATVWAGIVPPM